MNRIDHLFQVKTSGIVSVYFTAGYPKLDDTTEIIRALAARGTDLIEIGVPFSDPMADGKTIQNSSTVALKNGMTMKKLFEQLKDIRRDVTIPLILMGYLNPVMQYGIEHFCKSCAEIGIDGVILPDLPLNDYLRDFKPLADKYDLRFTMLITPETSDERIKLIDQHTNGFIYMVSTAATTGTQDHFSDSTIQYFERINAMNLRNRRLIGFGISNPETFQAAQQHAAGAIIGSGFIKALDSTSTIPQAVEKLYHQLGL